MPRYVVFLLAGGVLSSALASAFLWHRACERSPKPSAASPAIREAQERARQQYFWPDALERHPMRRVFSGGTDTPLAVGQAPPPLLAGSWLNGPPPTADALREHVVVIDVWDNRCTMCGEAAPAVVNAYEKYKDRGVVFIGMSMAEAEEAVAFVNDNNLSWPNGYQAGDTVRKLVGAAPTLFVVGTDGRIVWHDDRARMRHDIKELGPRLEAAIKQALATTGSPRPAS